MAGRESAANLSGAILEFTKIITLPAMQLDSGTRQAGKRRNRIDANNRVALFRCLMKPPNQGLRQW